jgi:tripartite-type tricarboxylate transporter receptor subunit TctC
LLVAPEMADNLKRIGLPEFPIKTPEQFAESIKSDLKVWGDIVRKGNIKPD